jgi:hypothetical protein
MVNSGLHNAALFSACQCHLRDVPITRSMTCYMERENEIISKYEAFNLQ